MKTLAHTHTLRDVREGNVNCGTSYCNRDVCTVCKCCPYLFMMVILAAIVVRFFMRSFV